MHTEPALSGVQKKSTISPEAKERVRVVIKRLEHAIRIKAPVRIERAKGEIRSLVKLYGIELMDEIYDEYNFRIDNKSYTPMY